MRGTRLSCDSQSIIGRIIPAHAGNTGCLYTSQLLCQDHPRTCGEHLRFCDSRLFVYGSSPHMRGTLFGAVVFIWPTRIIPAHAGNTSVLTAFMTFSKDHPRTCGEHSPHWMANLPRMGSSPHMRGTQAHPAWSGRGIRIIPAHAGNTRKTFSSNGTKWDHPRTCGEHREKR